MKRETVKPLYKAEKERKERRNSLIDFMKIPPEVNTQ